MGSGAPHPKHCGMKSISSKFLPKSNISLPGNRPCKRGWGSSHKCIWLKKRKLVFQTKQFLSVSFYPMRTRTMQRIQVRVPGTDLVEVITLAWQAGHLWRQDSGPSAGCPEPQLLADLAEGIVLSSNRLKSEIEKANRECKQLMISKIKQVSRIAE